MTNEVFQGLVLSELKGIKFDISGIKSEITDIKLQLQEDTDIIKALLHNQEITNAKLENLELNTSNNDSVTNMNAKIDTLNTRIFYQESELTRLRAIK